MLRLTLTTDTSPLWGAVPRWEVGVGDLFRDVSKRVLCSLIIWPDGPTSLGHSSSHPCRSGRSPWPAPGGRFVRDHRPWEQAGHTGPSRGPCDAPREWGLAGARSSGLGVHKAARREIRADDGATQVDSDAGAESLRIPGEGGGQGMRGAAGDRCLLPINGLPSPGTWRRGDPGGRGARPRSKSPPPLPRWRPSRPGEGLHTVSGGGELLAEGRWLPPWLAADIDGCRGFQRR